MSLGVLYKFYYLEDQELLDTSNSHHIYALHYVFKPRIAKTLAEFCDGWNKHGVRTAGNKTPHQLFTKGVIQLRHSGLAGLDFLKRWMTRMVLTNRVWL